MSNHGYDDNELPDFLREQLRVTQVSPQEAMRMLYQGKEKLGATGRFPLGKLTPDDEGEIQFAVAADPQTRTVILDFGKPVVWIGIPREDAQKLAEMLMEKVKELQ